MLGYQDKLRFWIPKSTTRRGPVRSHTQFFLLDNDHGVNLNSTPAVSAPWRLRYSFKASMESTYTVTSEYAGALKSDVPKTEHDTECGIAPGDLSGRHYHVSQNLALASTEFKVCLHLPLPDKSVVTKFVNSPGFCQLKI